MSKMTSLLLTIPAILVPAMTTMASPIAPRNNHDFTEGSAGQRVLSVAASVADSQGSPSFLEAVANTGDMRILPCAGQLKGMDVILMADGDNNNNNNNNNEGGPPKQNLHPVG